MYFGSGYIHPALFVVGGAIAGIIIMKVRSTLGSEIKQDKDEQVYDYMI